MTTPLQADLDALVASHRRSEVPQFSVAVWCGGTLRTATHGCAADTWFQAASISKPVAALAALCLVDRKLLTLDEPVNLCLARPGQAGSPSSYALMAAGKPRAAVTLRHLLSHCGGLNVPSYPGYPFGTLALPSLTSILLGDPKSNAAGVSVNTAGVFVVEEPGVKAVYSGGGYTVLQLLIEHVTGRPMADVVHDLVFTPLSMVGARYAVPTPAARIARGRVGGTEVAGGWRVYPELAAAGLWCTPSDLARFGAGIQAAVAGAPQAFLSQALAKQLVTPQFGATAWGLGLELAGSGGAARFGHTGQNEGYLCELTATVAPGPVIVVMTASDHGHEVLHPLVPALRALSHWPDPTALKATGSVPAVPVSSALIGQLSKASGGRFRSATGVEFTLTGNCYNWRLAMPGEAPVAVEAMSLTELESWDRAVSIELIPDPAGGRPDVTITYHNELVRSAAGAVTRVVVAEPI